MTPTARKRQRSHDFLGTALDAAMRAWGRFRRGMDVDPDAACAAIDRLYRAWGAAPAALPPRRSKARPDDVRRTETARACKQADDDAREAYIVQRYAALIRRGGLTAKQAREIVAEEVRELMHLPVHRRWDARDLTDDSPLPTYSEKSVARVLKNFSGR